MAVTYGPFAQRIWREALTLPGCDTLLESLAFEVGEYLGVPAPEACARMEAAWRDRTQQMRASLPTAERELASYYEHQETGILTSAYWHSLVPDRYALHSVSGLSALQHFSEGARVFEFGHGIGSTAILLSRYGFDVTAGDISHRYRDFAQQRVSRRGERVAFVDLNSESPPVRSFDAIVSFDVLEHVPDPIRHIARMHSWLKDDGLLVLNIAFGRDADNPEHIQPYRVGVLDRIRGLGFERVPWPTLLVFVKRDVGRARRAVYRAQDLAGAAVDDVAATAPRIGRVLRRTIVPPIA